MHVLMPLTYSPKRHVLMPLNYSPGDVDEVVATAHYLDVGWCSRILPDPLAIERLSHVTPGQVVNSSTPNSFPGFHPSFLFLFLFLFP